MTARDWTDVDGDEVRNWADDIGWEDDQGLPVADRGRLPRGLVDAYNDAHRADRKRYVSRPRHQRDDARRRRSVQPVEPVTDLFAPVVLSQALVHADRVQDYLTDTVARLQRDGVNRVLITAQMLVEP